MKRIKTFTLLELMVVIAIITIIASLLLPALGRSKNVVKGIACKSNMKQMGLAYSMYRIDYNDWLLPPWRGATQRWYNFMYSESQYAPSQKIFLCPSEPRAGFNDFSMSYGMNYDFGLEAGDAARPQTKGTEVSRFGNDSNLIVIADTPPVSLATSSYSSELISVWAKVYPITTNKSYSVYIRHLKRANTLLFDGHVQDLPNEALDWNITKIHWWPTYQLTNSPPLRKW